MLIKSFIALLAVAIGGIGVFLLYPRDTETSIPTILEQVARPKPLEKYTVENLSQTVYSPGDIEIGTVIAEEEKFTSYMVYFYDGEKRVSGMLNIPSAIGTYPVIVMIRGYAPLPSYTTGVGTRRGAEYLASNGFVTVSPDYLGYGESDDTAEDIFERRFQTYTTTLSLLASIPNVNTALSDISSGARIDPEKVGIWGHSNGGQVALTILEISQKPYPTSLWNPVSKPFPYSILFYTDEYDDYGKALRKDLARFEEDYDVDLFSLVTYLDRIAAPIQLHQGINDTEVPLSWSNELARKLEDLEKDIEYFTYPNSDHNLMPGGWNTAITRSAEFYRETFDR